MVTLLSVLALAACGSNGGGTDSSGGGSNAANDTEDVSNFPIEVSNDAEAIEGGTLDVAVVMDTQFQGLFQTEFYQDNYDAQFMLPSNESLFVNDADFKIVDGGLQTLS